MRTLKNPAETLATLKAKREKLRARLATLDARIAKIERAQEEAEQREIMSLMRQHGLTPEKLLQLLAEEGRA